jgi:hypothetical protein
MLQQSWDIADVPAPSESTLRRQVQALIESGRIVIRKKSQRLGDLYRLADLEADVEDDDDGDEAAPTV